MKVPAKVPDISGYVYLYKGTSKTSDGDGGKVARRGIETYLLVQLASVQLPLHPYPVGELRPGQTSTNFHVRYVFLKSVSLRVDLIPFTSQDFY
ncbi:hypothetical protein M0802_006549 [Mischocyttarus mexicanus]|nr:hypothetical protein M0802_006549 [Mischocyttarus mexicanus]